MRRYSIGYNEFLTFPINAVLSLAAFMCLTMQMMPVLIISTVHMCLYCSYVLIRVYYNIRLLPISINSYKAKHTLLGTVCTKSNKVISTLVLFAGVLYQFAHSL